MSPDITGTQHIPPDVRLLVPLQHRFGNKVYQRLKRRNTKTVFDIDIQKSLQRICPHRSTRSELHTIHFKYSLIQGIQKRIPVYAHSGFHAESQFLHQEFPFLPEQNIPHIQIQLQISRTPQEITVNPSIQILKPEIQIRTAVIKYIMAKRMSL